MALQRFRGALCKGQSVLERQHRNSPVRPAGLWPGRRRIRSAGVEVVQALVLAVGVSIERFRESVRPDSADKLQLEIRVVTGFVGCYHVTHGQTFSPMEAVRTAIG